MLFLWFVVVDVDIGNYGTIILCFRFHISIFYAGLELILRELDSYEVPAT